MGSLTCNASEFALLFHRLLGARYLLNFLSFFYLWARFWESFFSYSRRVYVSLGSVLSTVCGFQVQATHLSFFVTIGGVRIPGFGVWVWG